MPVLESLFVLGELVFADLVITELIHAYDVTEDEFNNRLICLLNIATGASRAFRVSDTHEKREMLSFIFQNLELREKKLEYTMRYPFNLFADANKTGEWCPLVDEFRTCAEAISLIFKLPRCNFK